MERSTLRAVTIDAKEWNAKGKQFLKQAEATSKGTTHNDRHENIRFDTQQAHHLSLQSEIRLTLAAGEAFRIAGSWYESAKAYARAAQLSTVSTSYLSSTDSHDSSMAASLYTEAGAVSEKLDINFANDYYKLAVTNHCNDFEFKAAAMLLERVANNFVGKGGLLASLEVFHRAWKLYDAANEVDDADRILERYAYFLGRIGDLIESSNSYKTLALRQANRNTLIFNTPRYALRSIVLYIAGKSNKFDMSEVQELIDEFCKHDCRLEESRELQFIYDLMQSISCSDLHKFADCIYSLNEVTELDDLLLDSLAKMQPQREE